MTLEADEQFYLPPLPTRKFPPLTLTIGPSAAGPSRRVMCNQASDTPEGVDKEEADELDKQVARRREIYQHGLFVKVRSPFYPCLALVISPATCATDH